jgi:hypothetical protein
MDRVVLFGGSLMHGIVEVTVGLLCGLAWLYLLEATGFNPVVIGGGLLLGLSFVGRATNRA